MAERVHVESVDESLAQAIFERNIGNSQRIITGEFEDALVDIIEQLENPPKSGQGIVPSMENSRRIARAMREGFAGLPPNGFEFAGWLWDVAPLHMLKIPQVNEEGIHQGYQIGFLHLRSIAAMTAEIYIEQQPQKVSSLVTMLDSSVGWLDAKNLIAYGMMSFYQRHFYDQYHRLLEFATDNRKPPAKLIPLVVAARMMAVDPSYTKTSLELVTPTFDCIETKIVYDGVSYALKSAGMYGDQKMLSNYLLSQHSQENLQIIELFCNVICMHRIHWSKDFILNVTPAVHSWCDSLDPQEYPWARQALAVVE